MSSSSEHPYAFEEKLLRYKQRYALNRLLGGSLRWAIGTGALCLAAILLEGTFAFSSLGRTIVYFTVCGAVLVMGGFWVMIPFFLWRHPQRAISDEAAAKNIGRELPSIGDKLINTLMLKKLSAQSQLALAGIERRNQWLQTLSFSSAIHFVENRKYLRYLLPLMGASAALVLLYPHFTYQSTTRLIHYTESYVPPMPFRFELDNTPLHAIRYEALPLRLHVTGTYVPEKVHLIAGKQRVEMYTAGQASFLHRFEQVREPFSFHFEADGYTSESYRVEVHARPLVREARMHLDYPAYTREADRALEEIKNVTVPAGTLITWQLATEAASEVSLHFKHQDKPLLALALDDHVFESKQRFFASSAYEMKLSNAHAKNKYALRYEVQVRPDRSPRIYPKVFEDTVFFRFLLLAGYAEDDYGLSDIKLQYKRHTHGVESATVQSFDLPLVRGARLQNFHYRWALDSLLRHAEDALSYRIMARDNDSFSGRKKSYTPWFHFRKPSPQKIKESLEKVSQQTQDALQHSMSTQKSLQERLQDIDKRLKTKKQLDWQDKQQLEQLLKEKKDQVEQIRDLAEQQERLQAQQEELQQNISEALRTKMQHMQALFEKLMDDETKHLYEELRRLLEKNASLTQVQRALEKIQQQENLLEQEIDRALELFKQLAFELGIERIKEDIEALRNAQEDLKNSLQKRSKKRSTPEQIDTQKALQERFDEVEQSLEGLKKMHESLEDAAPFPALEQEQDAIRQHQQESLEQLQNNAPAKSRESQEKTLEQLDKMQGKLQAMQAQMETMELQESIPQLTKLMNNLIYLSFEQERLIDALEETQSTDARFLRLSQQQFDLQTGAQATVDSLKAFARRNFQVSVLINEHIHKLSTHLETSIEQLRKRNIRQTKTQQRYAMTQMNEIALFLSRAMDQMQAQASMSGKGKGAPKLSELQRSLKERIRELKQGKRQGQRLSEELVRMIAEQEMIRRGLEEMSKTNPALRGDKKALQDLINKMKQSEKELSQKKLTRTLLERQKEIETRLLQLEHAQREQGESSEREAKKAKLYEKIVPPSFEEYRHQKEKELIFYRDKPLPLTPYYEKEVDSYIRRLGEQGSP